MENRRRDRRLFRNLFVKAEYKRRPLGAIKRARSLAIHSLTRTLDFSRDGRVYVNVKESSPVETHVGFYVISGRLESVSKQMAQVLKLKMSYQDGEFFICIPASKAVTEVIEELNQALYPDRENNLDISNFDPKLVKVCSTELSL